MRSTFLSLIGLLLLFSCSYTQKIKDGDTAYDRHQFQLATQLLEDEYDNEKSRVQKGQYAYRIGMSYKNLNEAQKAIEWFKIAYDYQYGSEALKEYAFALKQDEQYEEAIRAFKELGLEIGSPYEYRKDINACKIAMDWASERSEYKIEEALSGQVVKSY